MTTEELIQSFIDAGRHVFTAHTAKRSPEIRKLIRHETVVIDGVELNGNDSTLNVELTQEEKQKLTSELYVFLKENRCIEA